MCVKFPSAAVEPNLGPGYPSTYTLHFLPMVYLFIYIFFFELCVASALCEPPQQSSGGPAKPPLEPKWISSLNTHNSKTCL